MNEAPEKWRDRKFRLLLYPDDPTHAALMERLNAEGHRYVAILHDKDVWETSGDEDSEDAEEKKAHWHVVILFKNPVWNTALAKKFGIKQNYIRDCVSQDGAILYLVHHNQPGKFQYPPEEAFGPLKPQLLTLLCDKSESERALMILDMIEDEQCLMGTTDLVRKCCNAGLWSDLRRMGQFAVAILREHNMEVYNSLCGDDFRELNNVNYGNSCNSERSFSASIQACDRAGLLNPGISPDEVRRIRQRCIRELDRMDQMQMEDETDE